MVSGRCAAERDLEDAKEPQHNKDPKSDQGERDVDERKPAEQAPIEAWHANTAVPFALGLYRRVSLRSNSATRPRSITESGTSSAAVLIKPRREAFAAGLLVRALPLGDGGQGGESPRRRPSVVQSRTGMAVSPYPVTQQPNRAGTLKYHQYVRNSAPKAIALRG
jgi:hypothetical protein